MGDRSCWDAPRLVREQPVALIEMVQCFRAGQVVELQAYIRWQGTEETRYISLSKEFHLCYISTAPSSTISVCLPERSAQIFDSVFVSRQHMLDCIQAQSLTGDPLRQSSGWSDKLSVRVAEAVDGGDMLSACRALLLRDFLVDKQSSLPGIARVLQSEAARLDALSRLNQSIHGVLHCTRFDEQRRKCDMSVVTRMFDYYRLHTVRYLGSDACCNFEALKYRIQSEFATLFAQIQEQGVLTSDACPVLADADDSLRCVLLSVAQQVVRNIPQVQAALQATADSHSALLRRGQPSALD